MDGVPYGNFNPQEYAKHSVKLYTQVIVKQENPGNFNVTADF